VRTRYLSVDPYMRGRMRDAESYADPWAVGDVMRAGVVGDVVESNHPDFEAGDVQYRETVTEGFENAPEAFMGLFEGVNIGKQVVKVEVGED